MSFTKKFCGSNNLVVTEYKEDVKPDSNHFPLRNRIISGLSMGVLVVEAIYRSGSTITAKHAKIQGKKVFCIPSNINSVTGVGTNKLIQDGAKLVTCVEDILCEFENIKPKEEKIAEVPEEYKKVYNAIKEGFCTINQICKSLDIKIGEATAILTIMEIEGYVKQSSGQRFIAI